ncbi:hypothetical protein MPS_3848 [Mycobacterium pseudoshottsii JCM 15466]|nr:hypothetical protein MPS_3848 [Mycobacterium pseudoshottsii JCM 15466]
MGERDNIDACIDRPSSNHQVGAKVMLPRGGRRFLGGGN